MSVTDTVADPVTSDVVAGPGGFTYALSGGPAALLAGKPNNGFTLTRVDAGRPAVNRTGARTRMRSASASRARRRTVWGMLRRDSMLSAQQ